MLGRRGMTGGSDYTNLITRALASNETGLRFDDYNQSMNRRMQAAGMAGIPTQTAAALGQQGVMLPSQLAAIQGAGVGGLLGQYQNTTGTQTQSGGFGQMLGGLLGAGLSGWASGGFGNLFGGGGGGLIPTGGALPTTGGGFSATLR
jgi:hypothetical protein